MAYGTGCGHHSARSVGDGLRPDPIAIDAQLDDQGWQRADLWALTDGQQTYAYLGFLWGQRNLYFHVTCPLRGVKTEELRLRIHLRERGRAKPFEVVVTAGGQCLDPSRGDGRAAEFPTDVAFCKATVADDTWIAEIRIARKPTGNVGEIDWTATIYGFPEGHTMVWASRGVGVKRPPF